METIIEIRQLVLSYLLVTTNEGAGAVTCKSKSIHTYIYVYIYVCVYMCMYIYVYTYINIHKLILHCLLSHIVLYGINNEL